MTNAAEPIDASPRRRFSRRTILRLSLLLIVLFACVVARVWAHYWPHAVHKTTLESPWWFGGNWRNLSFDPAPPELADLQSCLQVARTSQGGGSEENRNTLEAILQQRPRYFYAEWQLARWLQANGDATKAAAFRQQSLDDAPVVLIQTFRTADGRPAAGLFVQTFDIECNRVKNHSLDPSLVLHFRDLATDGQGRIYLPVYDTVYRTDSMSYPTGYACKYTSLGWFDALTHLALLPDAIVTKTP